ncbi:MAG: OmpA family protein, partial [Bacteroidales bacterium]|nr:OmpA family protein [Bacteroidales bacterium]
AAVNNNSNNNVASNNNVPCDTIVKFVNGETAPFSIFFNKDSYQLRDDRDRINLQEIANVVIENDYIVNLRGTCDDATATSEYNKKLAENRCRKIKDELVKCGVPESKINMDVVGGVKELKPAEYDRRVFISFTK